MKLNSVLVLMLLIFTTTTAVSAQELHAYYIENNSNAVWLKMNITANQQTQVFINNTTGYSPNISQVFIFGDDFNSMDNTKWNTYINNSATMSVNNGVLDLHAPTGGTNWEYLRSVNTFNSTNKTIEFYAQTSKANYVANIGLSTSNVSSALGGNYIGLQLYNNTSYGAHPLKLYSSGGAVNIDGSNLDTAGVWYKYTIKNSPGNVSVYSNDTVALAPQVQTVPAGSTYAFHIGAVSSYNYPQEEQIDWVRVRQFAAAEPVVTAAGTQTINGIVYTVLNVTSPVALTNYEVNLSSFAGATSTTDSLRVETGLNPPLADFSANATLGGVPSTFQFTDNSASNPTSWLWDFGDGSTSTQQNPQHKYTAQGTYAVTLNATNGYGSNAITKAAYITTNYSVVNGQLTLFNMDASTLNAVPDSMFVAAKGAPVNCNATLSYNSTLHCVDFNKNYYQLGEMYFSGLTPAIEANYSFDIGIDRSSQNSQVYFYTPLAFIEIQKYDTGNYKVYSAWTADNGTTVTQSFTITAAQITNNMIHLSIENNDTARTNTVLAGGQSLVSPYRTNSTRNLTYPVLITPTLFAEVYVADVGGWSITHIYNFKQTIARKTVTVYSPNNYMGFGLDWQPVSTAINGSNYMLNNGQVGTIWADPVYTDADHVNLTRYLMAHGWELGIHFSWKLTDHAESDVEPEIDKEMADFHTLYGAYPTSWCCLQNADNITQAVYIYNKYGAIWRNGPCGVTWISTIGNIENGTYPYWWIHAIEHGAVYPVFTHQTDLATAPAGSAIDYSKFTAFSDGYKAKNVNLVGFYQYYTQGLAQNNTRVTVTKVDPEHTVLNVTTAGYPVLVNVLPAFTGENVYVNDKTIPTVQSEGGTTFWVGNGTYTVGSSSYEPVNTVNIDLQYIPNNVTVELNKSSSVVELTEANITNANSHGILGLYHAVTSTVNNGYILLSLVALALGAMYLLRLLGYL